MRRFKHVQLTHEYNESKEGRKTLRNYFFARLRTCAIQSVSDKTIASIRYAFFCRFEQFSKYARATIGMKIEFQDFPHDWIRNWTTTKRKKFRFLCVLRSRMINRFKKERRNTASGIIGAHFRSIVFVLRLYFPLFSYLLVKR